jgi:hypothetical protein
VTGTGGGPLRLEFLAIWNPQLFESTINTEKREPSFLSTPFLFVFGALALPMPAIRRKWRVSLTKFIGESDQSAPDDSNHHHLLSVDPRVRRH